jgi:hypothetical protein
LESPPLQTNFFNIPGVKLGSLESRGTWAEQSLKVPVLKFGEDDGPIFGEFSVDLKLDRAMNPQGGSVSGKLKTDPEFEKTEIRDLDLNDLFGGVNSEGWRSFRKEASGSWMFMLEKPKNPSG